MNRALLTAAALLLAAGAAVAGPLPGTPLPPADAALAAIEAKPAVVAAKAGVEAAQSRARALRAGPHEFALQGIYQQRDVNREGTFDEWEAGLVRGFRLPGKARVDRNLGAVASEHAANALADARHGEARALLAAWFDWLRASAAAQRDREVASALERTATAVQARLDRGDASPMQLELALAEKGKAIALSYRSQAAARQALRVLATEFPGLPLPGEPPEAGAPVAPPRPLDDWPGVIMQRSHELRLAELDLERATLTAERAGRDRWPDPQVGLRILNERGGAEKVVGLSFQVPLPSSYRSAQAAEARSEAKAAAARLEAARRELELTAAADVAAARAALSAWEPMQEAGTNAERHLVRAQRAYELGETSLTELLLSLRSANDVIYERRLAGLDAHQALARLAIDAHELWAMHDEDDHDHE